jgi:hypothetical protein
VHSNDKVVFAISEDPAHDQKELSLLGALKQILGRGTDPALSCIPRPLAFVETETNSSSSRVTMP